MDRRSQPHRSRFNNFLNVGRCDYAMLLQRKAHQLLALLNPQKGDVIELILDGSKKQKRGKKMEAVSWIHDPVRGRSIKGHQYVTAVLRFRGHVIPWGVRLYLKKEDAALLGQPFKKTTQLAADLIDEFQPPEGVSVRVLFDSYYLCPTVVKACRKKGFRLVSTLKSNRNLYKEWT
ncbi:MAG TPA: transposase [Anaerohalosphaeraceae bacterium]|nr:transposase [Anaerohalosphaeraceae bacterium]HQG07088.1 transposase [Anaerohalosphaeraceae bacterium]HQI08695.1 transposase [Anaerohalosphaeraceae bacterium]HQJ69022.1 transposase [Anaerohalosphaeraceae bacterium]